MYCLYWREGFPGGSDGKESTCNLGDLGLIPGLGRSPGGGHDNPLQYSCLENSHGQEEPGRLQSMGLQRVGQDWAINHKHWTEYLWFWLHQRVLCFKELWRKPFSLRKSNSFLLLPPLIVMVGYKERSHGAHDNHMYMLKVLLYISKYIPGCWSRF